MNKKKLLIVSATEYEIKSVKKLLTFISSENKNLSLYYYKNLEIGILITGIGICFTSCHLTDVISDNKYDLIINAGICGSFKKEIQIGSVVNIIQEEFADLGITDKNDFYTLFDENLIRKNQFPFKNGVLHSNLEENIIPEIKKVAGITVNSASGNIKQIENRKKKYNADVESMEGAAFFYVCLVKNIKFIQIRSVSNFVEERNKKAWKIPLAIENLNKELKNIINNLI